MEGWIKIHHKFLEWEWFQENGMVKIFVNILLRANFIDKSWKGIVVKRGQYVTTISQLSSETGLSVRTVRTCLSRLEQTGEIFVKTTNKFSFITISNYDTYQDEKIENDKQTTNKRQTNDKQKEESSPQTPFKEDSEEGKNNKETTTDVVAKKDKLSLSNEQKLMEERSRKFGESLISYIEIYGKEMIRAFYNYWSEPNRSKTKMRCELERTWDLKRRLNTWSNRDKNISNGTKLKQQQQQQRANEIAELNRRLMQSDE